MHSLSLVSENFSQTSVFGINEAAGITRDQVVMYTKSGAFHSMFKLSTMMQDIFVFYNI